MRKTKRVQALLRKGFDDFGYNFRSGFECEVAYKLHAGGIKFTYESDILDFYAPTRNGLCLDCNSSNIGSRCKYLVDFTIYGDSGDIIFIETKGRLTSKDRTKYVNIKNSNPDIDLRFLFQSDNWLTKTKTKRYSQWATQKGFLSATGVTSSILISQPLSGLTKS